MATASSQPPASADLPGACVWPIALPDETATARLAAHVGAMLQGGDLVTLSGDLGAGKSTFVRALIRSLTGNRSLEVPSPTFTLIQTYDGPAFPIVHADLYRLKSEGDLAELGWDEAGEDALVLVEWAGRAGDLLTAERLDIAFHLDIAKGLDHRDAVLTGSGRFAARLERTRAIGVLLAKCGWADARRAFMLGDASARAYERLTRPDGATAILMISPPRPDGPPIRMGRPYSAIARLSESIDAFLAMDDALRVEGCSAPKIYGADRKAGLAVLEDLGSEGIVDADGPIAERYAEATVLLAQLHARKLPTALPLGEDTYAIPPFDLEALAIEIDLLVEWYAPQIAKVTLAASTRATFTGLWQEALRHLLAMPQTWVLRDYHSPNIIWLADRQGIERVGLIDFQDCVIGHPAYDLASLLQDARVDVPDALELRLLGQYTQKRLHADPNFDTAGFVRAYAIAAAQRATKILGIFARLDKRDHKPQYLAHLPRLERYLAKNLGHPALADLKRWYEKQMPRALAQSA